ncbi:hypothetical protein Zmor_022727 [Zophobas morio]|uniref:Enoyl-CoA hydratase domain-containing protein 3, mitochondrial n=1 Tax=Zophobas morio TaxID=2755281 RepID=A0AA38M714_9CUCU|nr:hypothetical protein Zmor_022727 [Zophobas morio]
MFARPFYHLKHSLHLGARNSSNFVHATVQHGIANLVMDDHDTRNALSIKMMQELIQKITEFESANTTRVIVLGSANSIFSTGHDLKEMSPERSPEEHAKVFQLATQLMYKIIDSPVPIIAKVDGIAVAAGCQLVAQCDLAFCSKKSSFSTPGIHFGVFCSTPGIALARVVPKATALKLLYSGITIGAKEAEEKGLITQISENNLDEDVKAVCDQIVKKSRTVVELGKRFYYQQVDLSLKEAYKMGAQVMVDNLSLEDGKEGVRAFIEKRKPSWKHR